MWSTWIQLCAPVDSPHKGQWHGVLMFSLICASSHGLANNGDAGDLRRIRTHYSVILMLRYIKVSKLSWFHTRASYSFTMVSVFSVMILSLLFSVSAYILLVTGKRHILYGSMEILGRLFFNSHLAGPWNQGIIAHQTPHFRRPPKHVNNKGPSVFAQTSSKYTFRTKSFNSIWKYISFGRYV